MNNIQAIQQVQTPDRMTNQLQQNIIQTINQILKCPLLTGAQLTNQSLVTGDNTISHGLGRTLQGWFIVRYHSGWAEIYDAQDTNANAKTTLILNSSADLVVDIYVY